VWYWSFAVGEVLAPNGQPWEAEYRKMREVGRSALDAVRQFLTRQPNVKEVEAEIVIAMPRDLKTVAGWAECLELDLTAHQYRLKAEVGDR